MVEIAICIAVVAFALVAIIGVLPTGFQVQKENREDTIVNQDGTFWLEAIRSGSQGLDYLTNYVESVRVETFHPVSGPTFVQYASPRDLRTGAEIIGVLSRPKRTLAQGGVWETNLVRAQVRALSGSAAEKTPRADLAFRYRMTVELAPFHPIPSAHTNLQLFAATPAEWAGRSNQFLKAVNLGANFHELRLTLEWPVYPSGGVLRVGNHRKVFRTLVGGVPLVANHLRLGPLYWLQPSQYVLVP